MAHAAADGPSAASEASRRAFYQPCLRDCGLRAMAEARANEPARPAAPFAVAAIVVGWLALGPRARRRRRASAGSALIGAATWLLLIVLVRREPRVTQIAGRDARRTRDPARVLGVAAARPLHLPAAQRAGVRASGARPRLPGRRARRALGRRHATAAGSRCSSSRWRRPGRSAA